MAKGETSVDYASVAEARNRPGMRLVLSAGLPGPWGEAAKAVLFLRNIPFLPVAQSPLQANQELIEWTGIRNAPIAVYNDEPPVAGWMEILHLAERLGSGPSLLPDLYHERALALGIAAEIGSPNGLGWNRRLQIFSVTTPDQLADAYGQIDDATQAALTKQYHVSDEAIAEAPARIIHILDGLTALLRAQRQAGSDYFVGTRPSVADVYWAAFSNLITPLPHDVNPMPENIRPIYGSIGPFVAQSVSPELLAHRQMMFERHIPLPLDF
jgi:glutathione S-transferase